MGRVTARKAIKRDRLLWGLICGALVLVAGGIVLVVLKPWTSAPTSTHGPGEAEAVMTTKTLVYDGLWDTTRHSDEFYCPIGLALVDGNLVVADSMCDRIQLLDGEKNKRIGKPGQYGIAYLDSGALVDGYREAALFTKPSDVALAPNGDIIVCDTGNNVIRRMDDTYVITIAGNGESGYNEGKESEVSFNAPRSVAVDGAGTIYVADTMNHCIRRIDQTGAVTLFAGTPTISGYLDGDATQARFYEPCGLFYAQEEEALYVADSANHCIRKIVGGVVSTVAGMPGEVDKNTGYSLGGYVDGNNADARFNFPRDITMLPDDTLLVADSLNHAIRMITPEETRTLVGSGMAEQFYASAENLRLTRPEGICTDGQTLYISDTFNNRVVAVPLTKRILAGRPSREEMLRSTGLSTTSKYAYSGDIRVYIGNTRVDMGRVAPWNTPEYVYVPIRPLFEALGAQVNLDENTNILTVAVGEYRTYLTLDIDYFILKGIAVTTTDEIMRLFPYTFEWFPEFSLMVLDIPADLVP